MAETLVKNKVCSACGVDVRQGSLFCYNCGSSVTADSAASEKIAEKTITENILFPDDIADDKKLTVVKEDKTGTQNNGKITAGEKPKLKSAASMRRKPKTIQRKRVEVVWEEPESASNFWFILVALLLTLFAAGLWIAASYLK